MEISHYQSLRWGYAIAKEHEYENEPVFVLNNGKKFLIRLLLLNQCNTNEKVNSDNDEEAQGLAYDSKMTLVDGDHDVYKHEFKWYEHLRRALGDAILFKDEERDDLPSHQHIKK